MSDQRDHNQVEDREDGYGPVYVRLRILDVAAGVLLGNIAFALLVWLLVWFLSEPGLVVQQRVD